MTQLIEKSFLIDSLTSNNTLYRGSLTLILPNSLWQVDPTNHLRYRRDWKAVYHHKIFGFFAKKGNATLVFNGSANAVLKLVSYIFIWHFLVILRHYRAGIYLLKVNNRSTKTKCEICSNLTIKTPERRWGRSVVFIVNFEHISHLSLVFLLTLNM